jgi:hypothetical protein
MPPRRRGILRRIADALTEFFGGPAEPTPTREPVPEPEPPLRPLPPREPPVTGHESRMRGIFENIAGTLTGTDYLEWRQVYDQFSATFIDESASREVNDAEVERYWDEFLRAYYLTSDEYGSVPRRQFHSDTGIPRSEIDWDLWQQIKRGTP